MERSCSEAAAWMTGMHRTIEELIRRHSVRKVRERGGGDRERERGTERDREREGERGT